MTLCPEYLASEAIAGSGNETEASQNLVRETEGKAESETETETAVETETETEDRNGPWKPRLNLNQKRHGKRD